MLWVDVLMFRCFMVNILHPFVWLSFWIINLSHLIILVCNLLIGTTCVFNQFLVNKRRIGPDLSYVCYIVLDSLTWSSNWNRVAIAGSLRRRLLWRRCEIISSEVLAIIFLAIFSFYASTSLPSRLYRLVIVWSHLVGIRRINLLVVRILVDQFTICVLKYSRFTLEHCWHLNICRPILCFKDVDEIVWFLIQFLHHLLRQFI